MSIQAIRIHAVFNVMVLLATLSLGWWLWNRLRAAKFMNYRYLFFALRDRLGHLAASGEIDPQSTEYRTVLYWLNTRIQNTEEINMINFIRNTLIAEERSRSEEVDAVLKTAKSNEVFRKILVDTVNLTLNIIERHSLLYRIGRWVLKVHRWSFSRWLAISRIIQLRSIQQNRLQQLGATAG